METESIAFFHGMHIPTRSFPSKELSLVNTKAYSWLPEEVQYGRVQFDRVASIVFYRTMRIRQKLSPSRDRSWATTRLSSWRGEEALYGLVPFELRTMDEWIAFCQTTPIPTM